MRQSRMCGSVGARAPRPCAALSANVTETNAPARITVESRGTESGHGGRKGDGFDEFGNVFVTGSWSNNAFQFAPSGAVTEIIDAAGSTCWPPGRYGRKTAVIV
jgi:hypothetical protein